MNPVDHDIKGNPIYDPLDMKIESSPLPIPGINSKPWYEMTAEELIALGHKPVMIEHTPAEGWHEVEE